MEPYNVKVLTFPDLSKQYRVYDKDVVYRGRRLDRVKNPFDDNWTYDITGGIQARFEHSADVSMKRTKAKVYNYAKCNDWEWFVTFTFSPDKVDRYDYDACVKLLSKWLNNIRRSSPALSYLVVPERHKDGAWHFHGLFSGLNDKMIVWSGKWVIKRMRASGGRSKYVRTEEKIYKFGSYKLGWMTATKVREKEKVTSYICKYITKDLCDSSYGRKRYWCSRNLLLPLEEVYRLDAPARFVLTSELGDSSSYQKVSCVQYGDMTQAVQIFDLQD